MKMIFRETSFFFLLLLILMTRLVVHCEWTSVSAPLSAANYKFVGAAWSNDKQTVVAAGQVSNGGLMIRSTDQGLTWNITSISQAFALWDITAKALKINQNYVTYFLSVDDNGNVFLSLNNGVTWQLKASAVQSRLLCVCLGSNGRAFTTGFRNKIFSSTNNTNFQNWTLIATPINPQSGLSFYGISTYDGSNVITVGSSNNIYFSRNSFSTFTKANIGTTTLTNPSSSTSVTIYSLSHGNASVAIAAGSNSYVAITYNFGATWKLLSVFKNSGYTSSYHSVSMIDDRKAFIMGTASTTSDIYRTINGGLTWNLEKSVSSVLYSLSMVSLDLGVAGALSSTYVRVTGNYIIMLKCNFLLLNIYFILYNRSNQPTFW
jgi:hypothetical protein